MPHKFNHLAAANGWRRVGIRLHIEEKCVTNLRPLKMTGLDRKGATSLEVHLEPRLGWTQNCSGDCRPGTMAELEPPERGGTVRRLEPLAGLAQRGRDRCDEGFCSPP